MIRSYEEEKKLTKTVIFIEKDLFDITISFKKRSDVLTTGYTYFDTSVNKTETIEFYDYYNQLKDFGFKWENDYIRYEINLSTDQKQIEQKIWCVWGKGIYLNI